VGICRFMKSMVDVADFMSDCSRLGKAEAERQRADQAAENAGTLGLWDAATGQPRGALLQGHAGAVTSAAFSPDGRPSPPAV
jgi:hypothetical protein